jgi:hypothetical protein
MHVRNKSLIYIALATGCIWLIPLIAMQLSDEWTGISSISLLRGPSSLAPGLRVN